MRGRILGVVGAAIGVVMVAFVVLFFIAANAYRIPAASMEPTLHCARPVVGCRASGSDRVLALAWIGVGRGDIVVFRASPQVAARCGAGPGAKYVKRVIGLAGDTVVERDGMVSVNGRRLAEPYVLDGSRDHAPTRAWHVPAGSYFLLGDNRSESCDSRFFGSVPKPDVTGRVVFRYWPLSRLGSL